MHVKKDDKVTVLTGKDRGKSGKVLRAFPSTMMVLVEGMNIKKKHQRSNKGKGKGEIVEKAFPIHASNVRKMS